MTGPGMLILRSGTAAFALRLDEVIEVGDRGAWQVVPSRLGAMRGVTAVRGRLVPLLHLGALVEAAPAPEAPAPLVVTALASGRWLALEVDTVDSAAGGELLEAPEARLTGLSSAALRQDDQWIPVLNLEALARRWQEPAIRA